MDLEVKTRVIKRNGEEVRSRGLGDVYKRQG